MEINPDNLDPFNNIGPAKGKDADGAPKKKKKGSDTDTFQSANAVSTAKAAQAEAKGIMQAILALFSSMLFRNPILQMGKNMQANDLSANGRKACEEGISALSNISSDNKTSEISALDLMLGALASGFGIFTSMTKINTEFWKEAQQQFTKGAASGNDLAKPG